METNKNRRNFLKSAAVLGAVALSNPLEIFAATNESAKSLAELKPVNGKYELPALGYAYNALEPHFDAKTMEIHHTKHHQAYINKLNEALEKEVQLKNVPLEYMLRNLNSMPDTVKNVIRNHGGGHWNHTFFWESLAPQAGGTPKGELAAAIDAAFGSFDAFKEKFANAGMTRFGSGWAWLSLNDKKELFISSTPNQDNPLMDVAEVKGTPLLGVDVWEHAYYLKYQNRRADYLGAFWNVISWDKIEARYQASK